MKYLIKLVDNVVTQRMIVPNDAVAPPNFIDVTAEQFAAIPILSSKSGDTYTPAPVVRTVRLSLFDFSELFTLAERTALRTAREANISPVLTDAVERFRDLEYIDLADARVPGYLDMLVQAQIIAAPRKAQILAGQKPA